MTRIKVDNALREAEAWAAMREEDRRKDELRDRVATAIYEQTEAADHWDWPDTTGAVQRYVYRLADAAMTAMRNAR